MRFFLFSSFLIFTLVSTSSGNNVFEGVKNDDGDAIHSAVKADPSLLESIGPGGQTPLLHAVLTGKLNAVKTLLEINANALATEKDGYNVLHAAGFQGRDEILEVLLEHFKNAEDGFALDPKTDKHADGYYPMHVSSRRACKSLCDRLIRIDSYFSKIAIYMLQRACWGRQPRHAKTVSVFLRSGVPFDLATEDGKTCERMTQNEGTRAVLMEHKDGYEL